MPGSLWLRAGFTLTRRKAFERDPVGVLLRQDVATGATMALRARVRSVYTSIPREWVHDGWLAWMLVLHKEKTGQLEPMADRLTRYRVHASQQTGSSAAALGLPRRARARAVGKGEAGRARAPSEARRTAAARAGELAEPRRLPRGTGGTAVTWGHSAPGAQEYAAFCSLAPPAGGDTVAARLHTLLRRTAFRGARFLGVDP